MQIKVINIDISPIFLVGTSGSSEIEKPPIIVNRTVRKIRTLLNKDSPIVYF